MSMKLKNIIYGVSFSFGLATVSLTPFATEAIQIDKIEASGIVKNEASETTKNFEFGIDYDKKGNVKLSYLDPTLIVDYANYNFSHHEPFMDQLWHGGKKFETIEEEVRWLITTLQTFKGKTNFILMQSTAYIDDIEDMEGGYTVCFPLGQVKKHSLMCSSVGDFLLQEISTKDRNALILKTIEQLSKIDNKNEQENKEIQTVTIN